jgi:hypothetical protein
VFVVGPFLGALAAVPFHIFFRSEFDTLPAADPIDLRATATSEDGEPQRAQRSAAASAAVEVNSAV